MRRAPQQARQLLIDGREPFLPIDDEEQQIAGFQRDIDFGVDLLGKVGIHLRPDAAGVDDGERRSRPSLQSAAMRSRVTPGMSWTIEMRRPARRLKSADLPTLGRPTMATVRGMGGRLRANGRRAKEICARCAQPFDSLLRFAVAASVELADAVHDVTEPGDRGEEAGELNGQIEELHLQRYAGGGDRFGEESSSCSITSAMATIWKTVAHLPVQLGRTCTVPFSRCRRTAPVTTMMSRAMTRTGNQSGNS